MLRHSLRSSLSSLLPPRALSLSARIKEYRAGRLFSGEMKAHCIATLQKLVGDFQQRKATVTDDQLRAFMDPTRRLTYMDRFPKLEEVKKEKGGGEKTAMEKKKERVAKRAQAQAMKMAEEEEKVAS